MADNVPITAGSGTTISTDDIGGVHYQRVKLAVTAADDTTGIGHAEDAVHASGDGGIMSLAVRKDSAVALGADGDYMPQIVDAQGRTWVRPAPAQVRIQVTPVNSTAAYASGDVIGGTSLSVTIANAARISGGSGQIMSILVLDKTQAQRANMDIMLFDRQVTAAADNAAVATSDTDMLYCLGVVNIGPYNVAFPGTPLNSISCLFNVGIPFVLNGTDLHMVVVSRGTPTYSSTSDLIFTFVILQD